MKQIILLFTLYFLSLNLSFHAFGNDENFWKVRNNLVLPTEKQKTFGIAVVFVDLQQANVVLTLRRIKENSINDSLDDPDDLHFFGSKKDAFKLDFSGRTGMISINLPEGLYQITQVDVPHFDLPYKISTDNSDTWRFSVQRAKINYIGTMKVKAIRSKESVDTAWLNQFATHLEALKSSVNEFGLMLPIVHGSGYKDPFSRVLEGPVND